MSHSINDYKVKRLLLSGDYVCTDVENKQFLLCRTVGKPFFHNVRIQGIVLPIEYVYLHDNQPYGCFPLSAGMQHCLSKAKCQYGGALCKNLPSVFWQLTSLVVNASNDKTLKHELISCLCVDNLWLEHDKIQLIWNPKQQNSKYSEDAAVSQLIRLLFLVNYGREKDEERLIGLKQTECTNILHRMMTNKMTLIEIAHECKVISDMSPKKRINTGIRSHRFSQSRNNRRKLKKQQPRIKLHRSPKKADSISFDNVYRYAESYKIEQSLKANTLFRNRRRTITMDYNVLTAPQRSDDITSLVRLRALQAFQKQKKYSMTISTSVEHHDQTIRSHLSRQKQRSIEHMQTVRRYYRQPVTRGSQDKRIASLIRRSNQLKQPRRLQFEESEEPLQDSESNHQQMKQQDSSPYSKIKQAETPTRIQHRQQPQIVKIPDRIQQRAVEKPTEKEPEKIEKKMSKPPEMKRESTPQPKRQPEKVRVPEVIKNVVESSLAQFDQIPQVKTVEKSPTDKPKEKQKPQPKPQTAKPQPNKPPVNKPKAQPPPRQAKEQQDDLEQISLAKPKEPPKEQPKPKQKQPSRQNIKTQTSQTSEKRNSSVQEQVEEYIAFINLMGQAVGKSQKTIKTVQGLDTKIDWFTGVFYLYKRFLRQRKKIENCLENGTNKLNRKGKEIDQVAFQKWLKTPARSSLLASIRRDNAQIEKAIAKMHQTLIKKHASNQRIVKHADLTKHTEEESFIAIQYVLSQCDDLLEMEDVLTVELMAHIVQIIDALYIMAELDDKLVMKVDVKERKQLKNFQEYFEKQQAQIGQLRRIYGI